MEQKPSAKRKFTILEKVIKLFATLVFAFVIVVNFLTNGAALVEPMGGLLGLLLETFIITAIWKKHLGSALTWVTSLTNVWWILWGLYHFGSDQPIGRTRMYFGEMLRYSPHRHNIYSLLLNVAAPLIFLAAIWVSKIVVSSKAKNNRSRDKRTEASPAIPRQGTITWKCECGELNIQSAMECRQCGRPRPEVEN